MNYKEAKEIKNRSLQHTPHNLCPLYEAKGFIEAVEKFKPVFESAQLLSIRLHEDYRHNMPGEIDNLDEALESYRRDVLGKKE